MGRGVSAAGADGVFANLSAFRLVGKSGSRRVGGAVVSTAGMQGAGAKSGTPEKRGVGTPAATFPLKRGEERGVCPPRIDTHTETVRKRLTKKSQALLKFQRTPQ